MGFRFLAYIHNAPCLPRRLAHLCVPQPRLIHPNKERFHWNMAKAPNSERVVAFKGDSLESLAGLVNRGLTSSFDAVYVDASHEVK